MSTLNLSLVQYDIAWKDKSTNFSKIRTLTQQIGATDLMVLPEMFQTAFSVRDTEQAEDMDGESVEFLRKLAHKHSCNVGASLMIKLNEGVVNRFLITNDKDVFAIYDKQHLFALSDEDEKFRPGTVNVDTVIKGFKCRMIICYDLRFPYTSFNTNDYDLLLVIANWPSARIEHWDRLLQARAIENQAYVAGVNRVGMDPFDHAYPGHSSVYDPMGKCLLRFTGEEVQQIELSKKFIDDYRKNYPFISDRK